MNAIQHSDGTTGPRDHETLVGRGQDSAGTMELEWGSTRVLACSDRRLAGRRRAQRNHQTVTGRTAQKGLARAPTTAREGACAPLRLNRYGSEVTGRRLSTLNPQPSIFLVFLFLFLGAFELFAEKPQFQDVNALLKLPTTTTNETAAAPPPTATNIVNAGFTNGSAREPQFQDVNALLKLPIRTTNETAAAPSPAATNIVNAGFTNGMETLDDTYKLAIGDGLSFRIEEDLEEPTALVVTDSGDLEVPYIGRFPAENKTCKQLARELKAALEKDYYYQATVIIAVDQMAKSRGKVYLVGPVRVPGPQDIPSDEILTLSKAIMRAGGFNDFADRHNVKVTRKARSGGQDKKTFVVDVGQIFDKGKVELDLVLEADDLIFIPERLVRF